MSAPQEAIRPADPRVVDAVAVLDRAVTAMLSLPADELTDTDLQALMAADEQAIRRLTGMQCRLAATRTRRRATQAHRDRPDDPRAPQKAAQQLRRELTDDLGITPAQAKQTARTGRDLEGLPDTAAAFEHGRLTHAHVRIIAEVTAHFSGAVRHVFERELLELAASCRDAVQFGRAARRRLIERDHDAAMADLQRKKARRRGRVTQTPDGTTRLSLETVGLDGELVHTAVDAFRRPDTAGEHRSAEHRTHDAIVAAFQAALHAGKAPTQHGVRPHVSLIIRGDSVADASGAADTAWTGPLPYREVARILGDCHLARVVTDARELPMAVSSQVRTVPMALWRALLVRDGGCIWPGCDAPPGWCQVAHLEVPYRHEGRLSPDTAGLLCTAGANHHARYDQRGYRVAWVHGRPQILTPDGAPVSTDAHARRASASSRTGSDPSGESSTDASRSPPRNPPSPTGTSPPQRPAPRPSPLRGQCAHERPGIYRIGCR